MTYLGTVQNGIIVLKGGAVLPEGSDVRVVLQSPSLPTTAGESPLDVWNDLAKLAEEVESIPCDLPEDLALNHDHYLYGVPKRS
jgi:hypothetical protein